MLSNKSIFYLIYSNNRNQYAFNYVYFPIKKYKNTSMKFEITHSKIDYCIYYPYFCKPILFSPFSIKEKSKKIYLKRPDCVAKRNVVLLSANQGKCTLKGQRRKNNVLQKLTVTKSPMFKCLNALLFANLLKSICIRFLMLFK